MSRCAVVAVVRRPDNDPAESVRLQLHVEARLSRAWDWQHRRPVPSCRTTLQPGQLAARSAHRHLPVCSSSSMSAQWRRVMRPSAYSCLHNSWPQTWPLTCSIENWVNDCCCPGERSHPVLVFLRFLRATAGTAIARLSHRNSVCLSVRPSVTRVDQANTVQARIIKSSPSAAPKTSFRICNAFPKIP